MLRFDRIFLTLMISLHFACYSLGNKAYLTNDNSYISAHLSYYKHQQDEQPDEHNASNKNGLRPECYLLAQKLKEQQVVTLSKNR